ncbi:hypothetical protein [Micromonospora sp. NBC_00421]|uniref:hypothetical protein n=1 Tax=Micromonospora sp. NBC_00421 TaxID=2975976 RepID=UPI002E2042BB
MTVFERLRNRWSQGLVALHRGQTLLHTGEHAQALAAVTSAAELTPQLTRGSKMDDPIPTAIAVTLSTRAVEGLTDAAREALASLMHLVRRKATDHRALRASLAAEPASAEGDDRAAGLRLALADAAAQDPNFDQELRRRWEIFHQTTVRSDAVTNALHRPSHDSE